MIECRIVNIAVRAAAVEGRRIHQCVERGIFLQPSHKIGVGKEGAAEGDKIPSAIANRRLSASAEADDEQLRAIAGAITREVKLPADGFVVGELVQEALHGKSWTPPPHLCSVPP